MTSHMPGVYSGFGNWWTPAHMVLSFLPSFLAFLTFTLQPEKQPQMLSPSIVVLSFLHLIFLPSLAATPFSFLKEHPAFLQSPASNRLAHISLYHSTVLHLSPARLGLMQIFSLQSL